MPFKGTKEDKERPSSKPRKRVFQGNQFTSKEATLAGTSASKRKLDSRSIDEIAITPTHCYRIIEFWTVFGAICEAVICKDCKRKVSFEESGHRGLGFKIVLVCLCGREEINSGPYIKNSFEINRRIVFVMRLLGIAREGINLFCGLMDLGQGISKNSYNTFVEYIHHASKEVFEFVCNQAVQQEKEENIKHGRPENDLKVSGDGSWKKRGFTSLFGVTTLIGYYTGKVVDLVVKSSYCQACTFWKSKKNDEEFEAWYEDHQDECSANHRGSAGKMEVDSIMEMFANSEEKYGVKYENYIGDGDSKVYKAILEMKPYSDDFEVIKSECIGHVEKRMGSRLRNIKKNEKLGGKGKLTDTLIKKLTKYYGLAIRRNVDSVDGMEKAIMATYDHMCSTDENPKHENCPAGSDSWCKWRIAEAAGDPSTYHHPPALHPDVAKHILSIYQDLSRRDLLERCLGGHTQNPNESYNATVWRMAPKHLHSGIKIIGIAAFIAACIFNDGFAAVMKIMNVLDIKIGQQCKFFADQVDEGRLRRQNRRSLSSTKEARTARRLLQIEQNEFYEEVEGSLYAPGIAD